MQAYTANCSPMGSLCHTPGVVGHLSSDVCCVSSVSTITTRNNQDIKSIFDANAHHVPGLCLLGSGGVPYTSYKIMAQKPHFHDFYSGTTSIGSSYYERRLPKTRPSYFV